VPQWQEAFLGFIMTLNGKYWEDSQWMRRK